jgi:hypothetical protein
MSEVGADANLCLELRHPQSLSANSTAKQKYLFLFVLFYPKRSIFAKLLVALQGDKFCKRREYFSECFQFESILDVKHNGKKEKKD